MSDALDRVTDALHRSGHTIKNGMTTCPAHDDSTPSLSVTDKDDKVLLHCHAGCSTEDVVAAVGLDMKDLFHDPPKSNGNRRIDKIYDYTDADGKLIFQVVRYQPKDFLQRKPDGRGGWIWKGIFTDGTAPTLYRLPEVITAVMTGKTVFIVEGEKDADALVRAGRVATCGPMGAGKWDKVAGVAKEVLEGARVAVVADKDADGTGYRHALDIVRSLDGVAANIWIREARTGKDAADHLAHGLTVDDMLRLTVAELEQRAGAGEDHHKDNDGQDTDAGPFAHVKARHTITADMFKGASWIGDDSEDGIPRWGTGHQILWHRGEALLLGSPTGLGKTTVSGQVVRAVVGLQDDVLGHAVEPAERALYFALDRPRQIRRALNRVFTHDEQAQLEADRRLLIWDKPLPVTLNAEPDILAAIAWEAGADLVIVDSLKDTVTEMSDDKAGLAINRAVQQLVGNGIDTMVNAHLRKVDTRPASVNDLFGSSNIVNGMGTVLILWGVPGSGEAVFYALKSPADMPDEMAVTIDYETGAVDLAAPPWDALAYLNNSGAAHGVTVQEAAHAKHNRDANVAEQKRVRRALDRLVDRGMARREEPRRGGPEGSKPARYWPVDVIEDLI